MAIGGDFKPYDLNIDFHRAGINVLNHRDPILNAPQTGWNYLPTYAIFLAGNVFIERHFGVPWMMISRVGPILFDLGVVVLVGLLAGRKHAPAARFQYATNPLIIMVAAIHGQMEPLCLLFAVGSFVLIRRDGPDLTGRRVLLAGVLIALAISVKTWPALFIPALLIGLPDWRRRCRLLAAMSGALIVLFVTMPLTVGTPVRQLPKVMSVMLGYHPIVGTFGWSSVVMWLHPVPTAKLLHDPFSAAIGSVGSLLTLVAIAAAVWWWRRAHPVDIAMVSASTFQLVTASHGVQYLSWAMPFATARPTRWTGLMGMALSVYAAFGYYVMTLVRNWRQLAPWYYMASLLVIPVIALALPWGRRQVSPAEGDSEPALAGAVP
ncbi:DUF2029 domain-containing protein [Actinoallomurus purpureus]|nr:DUF2029 domain-containing protein [Actinoallomurus purpureus]